MIDTIRQLQAFDFKWFNTSHARGVLGAAHEGLFQWQNEGRQLFFLPLAERRWERQIRPVNKTEKRGNLPE